MKNVLINQQDVENYGLTAFEVEKFNDAILAYENSNTMLAKNIINSGVIELLRFMNYVENFVNPESTSYLDLASTHNIQDLVKEVLHDNNFY